MYVVSFRVQGFVLNYDVLLTMAAPNPVEDSSMPPDNWGPQEDQSMGPVGNGQSTGVSLPVDERGTIQDPENPDFPPRGSSVSENETFREKQVKVLRSFLSVLCFFLRGFSWVWHCDAGLHSLELRTHLLLTFRRLLCSVLRIILLIPSVSTGVYLLLRSRTKSTLVVFQNIPVKKIYKVASGR
jgi:hypothetical protein